MVSENVRTRLQLQKRIQDIFQRYEGRKWYPTSQDAYQALEQRWNGFVEDITAIPNVEVWFTKQKDHPYSYWMKIEETENATSRLQLRNALPVKCGYHIAVQGPHFFHDSVVELGGSGGCFVERKFTRTARVL